MKQRNNDLVVNMVAILTLALIMLSSYLHFSKYREFILVEDIVPILISVIFSLICMSNLRNYSSESKEGRTYLKKALSFISLGYLFLALSLFVSTKTVETTSTNVKEVDATIVNISKNSVLLSNNGSFEVIEDVMGVKGLKLGDKISTISYEERVAHFKSWTGITKDARRKVVTLKGS